MKRSDDCDNVVVHLSPVWKNRANFIISAKIEDTEELPKHWEQLWAKQISNDQFELCCIPFFIYDLALGDLVETEECNGRKFVMKRRVRKSGRRTIRVDFRYSDNATIKENVIRESVELGCLLEWYSNNLLAVDLQSDHQFHSIETYLEKLEQTSALKYEVGC